MEIRKSEEASGEIPRNAKKKRSHLGRTRGSYLETGKRKKKKKVLEKKGNEKRVEAGVFFGKGTREC